MIRRDFPEEVMFERGEKGFLDEKTAGAVRCLPWFGHPRSTGIFIPLGKAPRFLGWKGSSL